MGSRLFTAVAGDILDTMGLQHQFLPPQIRALCLRRIFLLLPTKAGMSTVEAFERFGVM
jgi:hypothetical protein